MFRALLQTVRGFLMAGGIELFRAVFHPFGALLHVFALVLQSLSAVFPAPSSALHSFALPLQSLSAVLAVLPDFFARGLVAGHGGALCGNGGHGS